MALIIHRRTTPSGLIRSGLGTWGRPSGSVRTEGRIDSGTREMVGSESSFSQLESNRKAASRKRRKEAEAEGSALLRFALDSNISRLGLPISLILPCLRVEIVDHLSLHSR
mmetsp:Transcript_22790/g.51377  ORF Transcript_22790/g.51377 Transcript_22790/m.51377 type:complete len:111 (-) Transcript_22790:3553-3885(-)